ncbi:MAG TPA: hypothetical protein VFS43_18335 [Polyangiaceae bacterium]|nr:hypothetical protein [Polyangiaceae bacterium]
MMHRPARRPDGPGRFALITKALVAAALLASLAGCGDESQPEYWVKKLDDPPSRVEAVKRLMQFYEEALGKAGQKREAPEVKALGDKIIGPMTKAYVGADLDERTRVELLRGLAATRDPQAKEAVIKALRDYAAGKATPEEAKQAAAYVKQVKPPEAAAPLLEAFTKTKVSDAKARVAAQPLREAMVALADPSWKGTLLEALGRPIDPKAPERADEIYWQTVATDVLGELRPAEAAQPLFRVMLTPEKRDVAPLAVVALIKIGKGVVSPMVDVLSGKDEEMAKLAKASAGGDPIKLDAHLANAAIVLGSVGRAEALPALANAIGRVERDVTRAIVAREVAKLPASPDATKALQGAYERIKGPAPVPPQNDPARAVLADAAGQFMDAGMVPWLVKQVRESKGEPEEKDAVQVALIKTAIKLMKKDQADLVRPVVESEGTPREKQDFKAAKALLDACGDKADCYVQKLDDPAWAVADAPEGFTGVKAAMMAGVLGTEATRAELVKRLPKIKNAPIKFVALLAIDHLSPKGDAKTADELQKLYDEGRAKDDEALNRANAPMLQIIPRLRARAS